MGSTELLIASGVGHLLGMAVLWAVNWYRSKNAGRAAQLEAVAMSMAKAIERQKHLSKAVGSADDASVVKSITGAIAREAVSGGFEPLLSELLKSKGLNASKVLGPLMEGGDA